MYICGFVYLFPFCWSILWLIVVAINRSRVGAGSDRNVFILFVHCKGVGIYGSILYNFNLYLVGTHFVYRQYGVANEG